MASTNSSVFYIDPFEKCIHFYSNNGNSLIHEKTTYPTKDYDIGFFTFFAETARKYASKYPIAEKTYLVIPDSLIVNDIVTIPSMNKNALRKTEETVISGLFKDKNEIRLQHKNIVSNKQYSYMYMTGLQSDILYKIGTFCSTARIILRKISFAAETTAAALAALNPKIKDAAYLLMDIKEKYTRIVYVFRGTAVGKTTLPFGYSILASEKVAQEDMLFDHPIAELAVLNARERARAKALSVLGNDNAVAVGEEGADSQNGENAQNSENADVDPKIVPTQPLKSLPKKMPRKLPKYMLRPIPQTREGIVSENFRLFAKWALSYLASNPRLTVLANCQNVYVNMPDEYTFAMDAINEEKDENGVMFLPAGVQNKSAEIRDNLEIYGGLLLDGVKNCNVFTDVRVSNQSKSRSLLGGLLKGWIK